MAPGKVPVLAGRVGDAAVALEELVGHLEDREHQPALGTPGHVPAAGLAPDVFTRATPPNFTTDSHYRKRVPT